MRSSPAAAWPTIGCPGCRAQAMGWGWRTDNPVKGLKRYEDEERHRWLEDDELRWICAVLDRQPNQRAANAVRLQLLKDARMGEVLGAKKADFDLNRGVWIKPSHQTKQKRTEHLPLNAPAVALVAILVPGFRQWRRRAAAGREEVLGVGDAPGRDSRLSAPRQSAHLCLAPCLKRPQPRDRRTVAGTHQPEHDEALLPVSRTTRYGQRPSALGRSSLATSRKARQIRRPFAL